MLEQFVAKCKELKEEFTADFAKYQFSPEKLKQKVTQEVQDELDYPLLAKLKPEEQLQLAREYSALEKPTDIENMIMLSLDVDKNLYHERKFNHTESTEIMAAFAKCADNIAATDNSRFKHELSRNIRSLVRGHPETARFALGIYEQTLNDVDVIDCIRSCMSRNDRLIDKGFAAIEKNIKNLQKNCPEEKKKDLEYQIDDNVRIAFADLYGFYAPKNADVTDKITEHFTKFDKYMSRRSQLEFSDRFLWCHTKTPLCDVKKDILYDTFKEMQKDERPFAEIYTQKLEKYKDELEKAAHKEKVWRKANKRQQVTVTETVVMPNSLRYNLIHAGEEKPTAEKFHSITNSRKSIFGEIKYDKPSGGLWCSLAMTTDGDVGQWEDFCNREFNNWLENKFKGSWHVVPNDDCRILECNKISDIRPYLRRIGSDRKLTDEEIKYGIGRFYDTGRREVMVDYKAISHDYDLLIIKDQDLPDHPLFGSLDCDSAIVMDFNKMTVLDNKDYAKFLANESKRFAKHLAEAGIDHTTLKQPENIDLNKRVMQAHFAAQKGSDGKK